MAVMIFFKVLPNTPAAAQIDRLRAIMDARRDALAKIRTEYLIPDNHQFACTDSTVEGLLCRDGLKPDEVNWKFVKNRAYYKPLRPALKKALKAVPPGIEWRVESKAIFGHGMLMGASDHGLYMPSACAAWTDKGAVFYMEPQVRKNAKTWPEGLVEITATEAATIVEFAT